jgi:apolipoprotein N-acyltransferase
MKEDNRRAPSGRLLLSLAHDVTAATLIGVGWWFPGTWVHCVLSWLGIFSLLAVTQRDKSLKHLFLVGCLVQLFGFFWLLETIHRFGAFPLIAAVPIFVFFVLGSALQFPLFGFILKHLPAQLNQYALGAPIAWVIAEQWSIRIFPWHLGHSQLALTPLAQSANLFGSLGLSFLMVWFAHGLLYIRHTRRGLLSSSLVILFAGIYGSTQVSHFEQARKEAETFQVALIQGNIPLYREDINASPADDIREHLTLSAPHDAENTLIIWPESAIMQWTYAGVTEWNQDPRLPRLRESPLLSGAITFKTREQQFNSVLLIHPNGEIGTPYHKQILMPYGEYTPLSRTFPWLMKVNSMAANFTAGKSPGIHQVVLGSGDSKRVVQAGTLICYEDVVQSLARESINAGAQILVNLTNDAWFGDTVALEQHHLIASFRAIENNRFHLRATNTGKTAIVNPLGITEQSLPSANSGALSGSVFPIDTKTLYTAIGNTPWSILSLFGALLVVYSLTYRPDIQ